MQRSSDVYNKKKIARNTLLLYVQMFLAVLLQLYVVPVLLRTLGVEDYGIYNVVAGVVTMFTFISGSLSSAAQRFLAFSLGKDDEKELRNVFSTTMIIYASAALLIAFLLETIGTWFLNAKMDIPAVRIEAANWVFQFTVFYFALEIMIIPFRATIIAHERMNVFAYISIAECLLRLSVAILIGYIAFDSLITYSALLLIVAVVVLSAYFIYCWCKFQECRSLHYHWDATVGKSLLSYSGWNMVGSLAQISRHQGLNILQNLFFGPVVNAAHAIAQQVQGVANRFIDNVYVASRPQITKLYAAGREEDMWELIFQSAKLAFFLMMVICIPAVLEIDTVLKVWLKEVPPFTGIIAKLMLVSLLIETLVNQLIASFQAANRIKLYQITASTILLMNIPLSYAVLKIKPSDPIIPYAVSIALSVIYVVAILWNAKKIVNLDVISFVKNALVRNCVVLVPSFLISYWLRGLLDPSFIRVVYTTLVSLLVSCIFIWFAGLTRKEKVYIRKTVMKKILKR